MNGNSPTARTEDPDTYRLCLWGLSQDEPRVIADNFRASLIPVEQRCERCNGTGNELMYMYRACGSCDGTGVTKPVAPLTPGQIAYYADADGDLEGYDGA